jgi:hypothetical protein
MIHSRHAKHWDRRRPTWLWWLALLIIATGGLIIYGLSSQQTVPETQARINLVLAVTVVGAGICVICATADWWMRH